MSIALLSEVLGTQLDQSRVIHSFARCPCATSRAQTSASPCAGAGLLVFILEHVTQGALAGPHRVLQWGTQEAVGRPGAVTWEELEVEEKARKTKKEAGHKYEEEKKRSGKGHEQLSSLSDECLKG